jgi:hypothetical protein
VLHFLRFGLFKKFSEWNLNFQFLVTDFLRFGLCQKLSEVNFWNSAMFTGISMVNQLILTVVARGAPRHGTMIGFVTSMPSLVVISVPDGREPG